MSTLTPMEGSPIARHLRATKTFLRDAILGAKVGTTPEKAEFDVLEQDVFEILHLIRSWRNAAAPINRIPPDILSLIPDYWYNCWEMCYRDQDVIALTHVCRAWRELFTSRSSLWTDLQYKNTDKTLVYLERSKSSPTINLTLHRPRNPSPNDPLSQITHREIGRLKFLSVRGTPETLHDVANHLSHPAPLLEDMSINGCCIYQRDSVLILAPALFGGDLSSLHRLSLRNVDTQLPWRNMDSLTSLKLVDIWPVSTRQLLDFFESAPHLRNVDLRFETPTSSDQTGRLVSLADLKFMHINSGSSSVLLDHLLIPVGADLSAEVEFPSSDPPRFLDNLRNLPHFTTIESSGGPNPYMWFSGPNGRVELDLITSQGDEISLVLEYLAQFDTSGTERLKIDFDLDDSGYPPCRVLLPMKDLHTLTLENCKSTQNFIHLLDPGKNPSGGVICPKLEEIVIDHVGKLGIKDLVGMAAARESRGVKLKAIWILSTWGLEYTQFELSALEEHVSRVELMESLKAMRHRVHGEGDMGQPVTLALI